MMRRTRRGEDGFTLVELSVTSVVAVIALAIAGDALISLNNAAYRNDSHVREEQANSLVMAQIERDIRSAASISFPSGASTTQQLQISVTSPDATTSDVLWVYDPAAHTFTREVQKQGSFVPSPTATTDVANGSVPVFKYYDLNTDDISSTSASNIAACTTAVSVTLNVSSKTVGVGQYMESGEVALTNRLETLTAPGSGQCGSA